ncbi:MAG: hypothetical protein ACLUAR_17045 [Pilosibacter sp.]
MDRRRVCPIHIEEPETEDDFTRKLTIERKQNRGKRRIRLPKMFFTERSKGYPGSS